MPRNKKSKQETKIIVLSFQMSILLNNTFENFKSVRYLDITLK